MVDKALEDRVVQAIGELYHQEGPAVAIPVLANVLILVAEKYVKSKGEDGSAQITLEGEGARTIIIQKAKS